MTVSCVLPVVIRGDVKVMRLGFSRQEKSVAVNMFQSVKQTHVVFFPQTSCKSAVAFFQFSILANYFWLLVEGMYLQTLLALTFVFQKKYFWWYILIGWGK